MLRVAFLQSPGVNFSDFKFSLKAISLFFKGRMSECCDLYTFINFHEKSAIFCIKNQGILMHTEETGDFSLANSFLSEYARTSPIVSRRWGNEAGREQGTAVLLRAEISH